MNQLVLRSLHQETQDLLGIHYCAFGCGKLSKFYSPQYHRYRCALSASSCPSVKKRKSEYRHTEETKKLMSVSRMGASNNFFGKHHSEKTRKRLSISKTGKNHPWFGKHLPEKTRLKISEKTGIRMQNFNDGLGLYKAVKTYKITNVQETEFSLHGTWELKMAKAFNDKGILWVKGKKIPYLLDCGKHYYYPDFYLPLYDKYVEVKGYYSEKCKLKMQAVLSQNNIIILMAFKKEIDNLEEFLKLI